MSKQYFVWKDPNCKGIDPEWLELGPMEFYFFVNAPENKGRRFVTLGDDGDEEAGILVLEATLEVYKDWHNQDKGATRRAKANAAYDKIRVSLSDHLSELEELTYEDVVSADTESIELQVMKEIDLHRLRDFLKTLSDEEIDIVNALFLQNQEEMSERAVSRKLGFPQKTMNNSKRRILKKAQIYLAQNPFPWGN